MWPATRLRRCSLSQHGCTRSIKASAAARRPSDARSGRWRSLGTAASAAGGGGAAGLAAGAAGIVALAPAMCRGDTGALRALQKVRPGCPGHGAALAICAGAGADAAASLRRQREGRGTRGATQAPFNPCAAQGSAGSDARARGERGLAVDLEAAKS
eukprot:122857-Chlamydomonas_euryale.AAC.4